MAQRSRPKLTDLVRARPAEQESLLEEALSARRLPEQSPAPREGKPKRGRRPSADPRVSYTVGLRQSEVNELDAIARQHKLARNALGVYLLRHGLREMREGKLKLPVHQKVVNEIEMP